VQHRRVLDSREIEMKNRCDAKTMRRYESHARVSYTYYTRTFFKFFDCYRLDIRSMVDRKNRVTHVARTIVPRSTLTSRRLSQRRYFWKD